MFDCFDIPLPLKHLTDRIEEIVDEEPHPAGTFINLLPDDGCDDPLLAVTAQMMLIVAQEKIGRGANFIELKNYFRLWRIMEFLQMNVMRRLTIY